MNQPYFTTDIEKYKVFDHLDESFGYFIIDYANFMRFPNGRNFSGQEGRYNSKGSRNFVLAIDPDFAQVLVQKGFRVNVNTYTPKTDEPPETRYFIKVNVRLDPPGNIQPPIVELLNQTSRNVLWPPENGDRNADGSAVGTLDYAELDHMRVSISKHRCEDRATGEIYYNGYLKHIKFWSRIDEMDDGYYDAIPPQYPPVPLDDEGYPIDYPRED